MENHYLCFGGLESFDNNLANRSGLKNIAHLFAN